jgi:hypothetical protein
MLDDGIYGLSFTAFDAEGGEGGAERGEGIAVLRGGRILGSDPHGGLFRGCYRLDGGDGAAMIEVRLDVPPHGVLVTGYQAGPAGAALEIRASFAPPRPVSSTVVDVAGVPLAVELRYVGPL